MANSCACSFNPNSASGNMYFRGDWEFCTEYKVGDVVLFNRILYLAVQQSAGKDPMMNRDYWQIINMTPPTPPPTDRTVIDGGYSSETSSKKYAEIDLRRDSAINWEASNPRLGLGEIGIEVGNPPRVKIGNGIDRWNDLPYADEALTKDIEDLNEKYDELEEIVEVKFEQSLDDVYLHCREREDFLQRQIDTLAEISIRQSIDLKEWGVRNVKHK